MADLPAVRSFINLIDSGVKTCSINLIVYRVLYLYTFKINQDVLTPESLVYKTEDAKHRFYMRRAAKRIANIIDLCYNKVCQVFTALVSDKAHGNEDWNE